MILAFGESISILAVLGTLLAAAVILCTLTWILITRKRLPLAGWFAGLLALLPILFVVGSSLIQGSREYNPADTSKDRLVGIYSNGDLEIDLRSDGTYTSKGVIGLTSGTWSNDDWNLSFKGSSLDQPRWITRNGVPAILPFYSGADGSDGPLLTKK